MADTFTDRVVAVIKKIPKGKVASYGQVALLAGNPRGARQVVRVLNTQSKKHRLLWHRVINREGRISLPPGRGYELQMSLLKREKVRFDLTGKIDLEKFCWRPRRQSEIHAAPHT